MQRQSCSSNIEPCPPLRPFDSSFKFNGITRARVHVARGDFEISRSNNRARGILIAFSAFARAGPSRDHARTVVLNGDFIYADGATPARKSHRSRDALIVNADAQHRFLCRGGKKFRNFDRRAHRRARARSTMGRPDAFDVVPTLRRACLLSHNA